MPAPIHLAETGSTNDWVRDNASCLADGQWVVADRQTAGRGRLGRAWDTPPGNFAGSCLIRPALAETPRHLLSFVAALALHDAVAGLVPPDRLQLKWPNDLLLDGAKLSGILLETDASSGAIILGIGVNLVHAPALPDRPTAALAGATPHVPIALQFAAELGVGLQRRRAQWQHHGFAAIRDDWLARAHPVGTMLGVMIDGTRRHGPFEGLADDGALLIGIDGHVARIHAGDVLATDGATEGHDAARH